MTEYKQIIRVFNEKGQVKNIIRKVETYLLVTKENKRVGVVKINHQNIMVYESDIADNTWYCAIIEYS